MRDLTWLLSKVEETLQDERQQLADAEANDWRGHDRNLGFLKGWVEALEYVLWLIDPEEEEE